MALNLAVMHGDSKSTSTGTNHWMMEAGVLVLIGAAMAMLFASLLTKYRAKKVDSEYTPLVTTRAEQIANRV